MSELKLWADYNTQEEYDESTAEYNLREDVQVCKEEIAALRAENEALKNRECEWTETRVGWMTECGHVPVFEPAKNHKFCSYCGGKIKES